MTNVDVYKRQNENRLGKLAWLIMGLLVVLSYAPPAAGFLLPLPIAAAVMILGVLAGLTALHRLLTFREFRGMYQQLLPQAVNIQTNAAKAVKERTEKYISTDASFSSKQDGFEFLNELFIRRHQKILWKSSKRISLGALVVAAAAILLLLVFPEVKKSVNSALLVYLPYFTFIMSVSYTHLQRKAQTTPCWRNVHSARWFRSLKRFSGFIPN